MCDECARDPDLREAWDEYHAMTASVFITSSGDAQEFRHHVGLLHIAFVRAWSLSRYAMRPLIEETRVARDNLLAQVREHARLHAKAEYDRGRTDGMQYVLDTLKAREAEAELRANLLKYGHKGSA